MSAACSTSASSDAASRRFSGNEAGGRRLQASGGRRRLQPVAPLLAALLAVGCALVGRASARSGISGLTMWQIEASRNLSLWRSTLFARTMMTYKDNMQEWFEKAEAEGRGPDWGGRQYGLEPEQLGRSRAVFDVMNPFMTCPPPGVLTKVGGVIYRGELDGHKLLCDMSEFKKGPCVVFSLGSFNETSFEKAILDTTACDVYTFDCTIECTTLGPRHKYFKKCIGSGGTVGGRQVGVAESHTTVSVWKDTLDTFKELTKKWTGSQAEEQKALDFVSWNEAIKLAGVDKVDILKIDVEGFEYDALGLAFTEGDTTLPQQISMEVHVINKGAPENDFGGITWSRQRFTLSQLALWANHFANLGYGIVSRDDNPLCEWCSEFTFYKVPQAGGFLPIYVHPPHTQRVDNVTVLVVIMALMGGAIVFLAVKFVRKL